MRNLISVFFIAFVLISNSANAGSREALDLAIRNASRLAPEVEGLVARLSSAASKARSKEAIVKEATVKLSEFQFNLLRAKREFLALPTQEKTELGRKWGDRALSVHDAHEAANRIKELADRYDKLQAEFDCETAVPPCSGDADPEGDTAH